MIQKDTKFHTLSATKTRGCVSILLLQLLLYISLYYTCHGQAIWIDEIAVVPIPGVCGGTKDYIELYNNGTTIANLTNWRITFSSTTSISTYIIPSNTSINANSFIILCQDQFQFDITNGTTVQLRSPNTTVVQTIGPLPIPPFLSNFTKSSYARRNGNIMNGVFSFGVPSPNAFTNTFYSQYYGILFINEIANVGTDGGCSKGDWIEIFNSAVTDIDISVFILHDNRGPKNPEAFVFPPFAIGPMFYALYCQSFFGFAVDNDDTITLLDNNGDLVSTVGPLLGFNSSVLTYQRTPSNTYAYAPPTERAANIVTVSPTRAPTKIPTRSPTRRPTKIPTRSPTRRPTKIPTRSPTNSPTRRPTKFPTKPPTNLPTTKQPTKSPTKTITRQPTKAPVKAITAKPLIAPTKVPTTAPTKKSCGLFGLNLFCPFTLCGVFGRWLKLCS